MVREPRTEVKSESQEVQLAAHKLNYV